MYPNNDRISIGQMVIILVLTLIGVGILTLPRELAEIVGTDGWLALLAGGIAAMVIAFLHGYIIKLFPNEDFFEILRLTLTKPIAYLISIFLCLYFIGNVALITRLYEKVIKTVLLPRTPGQVIVITMLLVVIYLVRVGIEPMARLSNVLFPFTVVLVTILFALTSVEVDFSELRPFFQASPMDLLEASNVVIFSLLGFELLLIFGTHLREPEKAAKIGPIAVGLVVVFYLLLNVSVLGNFGEKQIKNLIWPTFNVFKTIEFPGAFIENVEVVAMSIWILSIFMTLAPYYLCTTILLGDIMATKEHNYFALPVLPWVYFIARYGSNIADIYKEFEVFSNYTAYPVILGIPLLIFMGMGLKILFKGKTTKS